MKILEKPTPRSFAQNLSWVLLGNIIYTASQGGVLIVLAQLTNTTIVGTFALALAVCSPIFLFTNLKLRDLIATDSHNEYSFFSYISVRLLTIIFANSLLACLVTLLPYSVFEWQVIFLIAITKSLEAISDVFYGFFQKTEDMYLIAISLSIKGLLYVLAIGLGILKTQSLIIALNFLIVAWIICFGVCDILPFVIKANSSPNRFNLTKPILQPVIWLKLIKLALPLGVATTLTSLTTNIPNYFIEFYLGEEQLGIFSTLSYLIVATNLLANALSQASLPRLSTLYNHKKLPLFKELLRKLLGLGVVLGLLIFLSILWFGELAIGFLYGKNYTSYHIILVSLALSSPLGYVLWFLNSALIITKQFSFLMVLRLITLFLVIIASPFIILSYGLMGATWIVLSSTVFAVVLSAVRLYFIINQEALYE